MFFFIKFRSKWAGNIASTWIRPNFFLNFFTWTKKLGLILLVWMYWWWQKKKKSKKLCLLCGQIFLKLGCSKTMQIGQIFDQKSPISSFLMLPSRSNLIYNALMSFPTSWNDNALFQQKNLGYFYHFWLILAHFKPILAIFSKI